MMIKENSGQPSKATACRSEVLVQNDYVSYDGKMKTFWVKGNTTTHALKIFPKESCTCPSKSEFYHVLAAKTFTGMEESVLKKLPNITS